MPIKINFHLYRGSSYVFLIDESPERSSFLGDVSLAPSIKAYCLLLLYNYFYEPTQLKMVSQRDRLSQEFVFINSSS